MKDITISGKTIKKELLILVILFVLAYALNIFAIAYYKTLWKELYSSLFYVFAFAFALYLLLIPIRILQHLILKVLKKKTQIKS